MEGATGSWPAHPAPDGGGGAGADLGQSWLEGVAAEGWVGMIRGRIGPVSRRNAVIATGRSGGSVVLVAGLLYILLDIFSFERLGLL